MSLKTVNPLDPRQGNFNSMRGWVLHTDVDRADPQSDWLIYYCYWTHLTDLLI